nr:hypothetical protein [Tanacetum cinerariifolium]
MYSFNLKNIDPSGDVACLFAKALIDESNTWHRWLAHAKFKNLNKLVKGNLVRGLPFKIFENDHTCVACQKEKQHKASWIKREYSNATTPQQNRVAGRKNMTLIEVASTMVLVTKSQNKTPYELLTVENQANKFAGPKEANNSAGTQANDDQGDKIENNTGFKTREKPVSQVEQIFLEELKKLKIQEKEANDAAESLRKEATHDIQNASTSSTNLINTASITLSTADDPLMHHLKEIYANLSEGIFTDSSYDDEGMVTDFNNLETNESVSPTPTIRIHTIHPKTKILGDPKLAVQTRSKVNTNSKAHALKMKVRLMLCKRNYCSSIFRRQEEGIDYDEVFAPVVRIEAIRIFLDFTSYIGFIVYQMDMKSAFLYGIINEEVYVSQPPSFVDPKFPNKVYKIVKALYGLHQAHSTCVKTASTPIETQKPLVKDEEANDVDVHLYTSMIGFLMYLTASRLDIMFVVCACSRFQVTPKTSHLHAVKRIFRYLKGQPKLGLWYLKVSSFDLEAYSDSDYAGANLNRKSTTGATLVKGRLIKLASPKKMALGKDISNPLMAGRLPKTTFPTRFEKIEPNNYTDDCLLKTLKTMFEKPDVEASVWRDQKGRYGLAKRYPLTHFTLEQMLNNVRLEVEEESEMSLELLRLVRRQLNEGRMLLIEEAVTVGA